MQNLIAINVFIVSSKKDLGQQANIVMALFHYSGTNRLVNTAASYNFVAVLVTFIYADVWFKNMISLLVVCHSPNFRRYEYNTISFYGLCNILCILTSYAPLHLMVKLRMRFCNSTQQDEEVVHSCVDRRLKDFQKYHRFAGTTILLCFIYALLPCRIYCSNKRGNTI